ncbi:MAG: hypothetical protein HY332_22620 [Chloroflexi bacterium]|nr:hypothetical protein [Chloroflexota bacterium]
MTLTRTILLVETDECRRQELVELLTKEGYVERGTADRCRLPSAGDRTFTQRNAPRNL